MLNIKFLIILVFFQFSYNSTVDVFQQADVFVIVLNLQNKVAKLFLKKKDQKSFEQHKGK